MRDSKRFHRSGVSCRPMVSPISHPLPPRGEEVTFSQSVLHSKASFGSHSSLVEKSNQSNNSANAPGLIRRNIRYQRAACAAGGGLRAGTGARVFFLPFLLRVKRNGKEVIQKAHKTHPNT